MNLEHFGRNIRQYRKERGLTQIDLAKKIGCSQAIIASYENGKKKPAADTLVTIANILKVSINDLMGTKEPTAHKPKNPKLWKKFEQIEELPSSDKRAIFRMIDGLLQKKPSKKG